MRPGQHVEGRLEVAVIGQRPPVGREQRLVAGICEGGLFEHGGGLLALPGGAQRLAVGQSGVGILRVGAVALDRFRRAPRIGVGGSRALRSDRAGDVGYGLAAPKPGGKIAVTAAEAKAGQELGC